MIKKYFNFLIILILLTINTFLIVFYFQYNPQKVFSVTFLDVGQGHATLFQTKNNLKFLIDSGTGLEAQNALSRNIGFFDKKLDLLIATHFDLDHVGIFPYITNNFIVSYFFDNGIDGEKNNIFKLIDKKLAENKVVRKKLVAGDVLQINPETKIEILFPPASINIQSFKDNDSSLVMKITHQNSSVLITGDSPTKIEKWLVKKYGNKLKSDILLAGHHGSKSSSSEIFLQTVQPKYLIISAGKNNSYHHPHPSILERAKKLNIPIYRTDQLGDLKFIYENNKLILQK